MKDIIDALGKQWIKHDGSLECPCSPSEKIEVLYKDAKGAPDTVRASEVIWLDLPECPHLNIFAWRILDDPESPLPTTQPQAKGEFGGKLAEFRDIVLHSRGLLAEDPNNDTLNAVLYEFDLLFPNLTKVAVVDEDTMEGLLGFLDTIQDRFGNTLIGNDARRFLAKLNAGETNE